MLYTWFYLVFSYSCIIINLDLVLVRKYMSPILFKYSRRIKKGNIDPHENIGEIIGGENIGGDLSH